MASQTIQEIEHAVLSLSPANLHRLRDKVNCLIQLSEVDEDDGDDGRLFYDALARSISEATGKKVLPYHIFTKRDTYSIYKKKLPEVLRFIGENLPMLKRLERMYLFGIATHVLVTNLQDIQIPVSLRVCCTHLDRIPELMDDAFPGYIQAGLLKMLVQAGLCSGKPPRPARERH